jgi:hypothetical protein
MKLKIGAKILHLVATLKLSQARHPRMFLSGVQPEISPGFPLQPEADPAEDLWRKKHGGMTDFRKRKSMQQLREFNRVEFPHAEVTAEL